VGGKYSTHERNENSCSILLGKLESDISLGRLIINRDLGGMRQDDVTGLFCLRTGTGGALF
jgi:hypothetical protein